MDQRAQTFPIDMELDCSLGFVCIRGEVEHIDGFIEAVIITDHRGQPTGRRYEPEGGHPHCVPSRHAPCDVAALWPSLIRAIEIYHADDLGRRYEAEPPRYDPVH